MSLVPVSRDRLRMMKIEEDEKKRQEEVNRIVGMIYGSVIGSAKSKSDTFYQYPIPSSQVRHTHQIIYDEFFMKNLDEVLDRLRSLFPDCSVDKKTLSRGNDGKMYDISKMDTSFLPFVNHSYDQSFIVVDWS